MKGLYSRGQSLSEYALVLTLIVAAVFGIQAYVKRGIQGVIKTTADTLSEERVESSQGGPKKYSSSEWDGYIKNYFDSQYTSGFVIAEEQGSNIYFYHFDSDPDDRTLLAGQDENTGDFTLFDPSGYPWETVDKAGNVIQNYTYTEDGVVGSEDEETYGKYAIVVKTSGAAVPIVQKGVIEEGLVDFKYTKPLTITSTERKWVITDQRTLAPVYVSADDWHVGASIYFDNYSDVGFNTAIKEDNDIYYYYSDINHENEVLAGVQDGVTGDFTGFDPNGYPMETFYDGGVQIYEYVDGGVVGSVDEKIYGKYAMVVVSAPPAVLPKSASITPMKTGLAGEKTTAKGSWEFTYEMGNEDSFSAVGKTGSGDGGAE